MALQTFFKYGLPFSFAYCTIYQQDIWREGDERLFEEQRTSWRKFFSFIDAGYHNTLNKLNFSAQTSKSNYGQGLVSRFDEFNFKKTWNDNISRAFYNIDQVVSNPARSGCRIYGKLQPYVSGKFDKREGTTSEEMSKIV